MSIKSTKGEKLFDGIIILILLLITFITLYPIYFVLIASISSPNYISTGQVILFPKGLNVAAYKQLLDNRQIWIGYRNSIIYTTFGTMVDLAVTIPCAYALSRKTLPGRKILMGLFVFTMYFSGGMIPRYLLINALGLYNSPLALIIPGCVNVFYLIIARSFFESSISDSLLESVMIDGGSYTRFFFQFAVPLSPAMLATIALYCIQSHWNAYLGAQMYIQDPELQTLQVIIKNITASLDQSLAEQMTTQELIESVQQKQLLKYAVVVISIVPLVIIYPFVQKFFVRGVMVGAIKG
jgi:putative aldouronate transport system permease protein